MLLLLPKVVVGSDIQIHVITFETTETQEEELKHLQQELEGYRKTKNHISEARISNQISVVYARLKQAQKALDSAQNALTLYKQLADIQGEVYTIGNIADIYFISENFQKAQSWIRQNIEIYRKSENRQANNLLVDVLRDRLKKSWGLSAGCGGAVSFELQNRMITGKISWQEILEISNLNLFVLTKVGDIQTHQCPDLTKGGLLHSIGWTYRNLGNYSEALAAMKEAVNIQRQKLGEPEQLLLIDLGTVYIDLGQYDLALKALQESFNIKKGCQCKCNALSKIGFVYKELGNYAQALNYLKQAEKFSASDTDRHNVLNYLGEVYAHQGEYAKALDYFEGALRAPTPAGEQSSRGFVLNNIGWLHYQTNRPALSLENYQSALKVFRELGDRAGERLTLSHIGDLFKYQRQSELAIIFYKQSVNITEAIRQDLRKLTLGEQALYTKTIADTYRTLADLLIQQGRLPEAQAVLELLKLRELKDFTRDAAIDSPGINIAEIEKNALQQILGKFTTLGNFSQEIVKCEQTQCATLKTLEQQRDDLLAAVNQELNQQRAILAKHYATESATLTPDKLNAEARRIVNAQPGTVLIYPIVLKDKIQFLLALQAGNGAFTFRPVETKVSAEALFKQIQTFRDQLSQANPDGIPKTDLATVQKTSQQLYQWLIQPLEAELNNANVKHLVIAPDSTTRYIPFAALHNGKQYLIERYSVSTITAASKTDTQEKMPLPTGTQPLLLAMGASTFPSLPTLNNVPAELDAITRTNAPKDTQGIYPGSEFLNTDFTYEALQSSLKTGTYRILHLATHGAFKAGRPEDSYLVPGRGSNLTTALIDRLGNYGLSSIHLVVLSACETAVGDRASDGMEIPGISYFFLKNEVKSVLASLWSVNDASTALIMQQFYQQVYKNLPNGMTKATALQRVQQDFINQKLTAKDAPRRSDINVNLAPGVAARQAHPQNFAHPYYWAPFILIGNSL